jgi:hypothetical protein
MSYTYLLKYNIKSNYIVNADNQKSIYDNMSRIFTIYPNDSILVGNPKNPHLWNLWKEENRIDDYSKPGCVIRYTFSFVEKIFSEKLKIVLGLDFCWLDESKYYAGAYNQKQGKKNISCFRNPHLINDIYKNKVYTSENFLKTNKWVEDLYKEKPNNVINASSGPTIFGINTEKIKKIKLNELVL